MSLRVVAASVLLVASACAVEDDYGLQEAFPFVNVRIGYGLVPKPDTYEVDVAIIGGGQTSWTDTVDTSSAAALSYSIVGGRLDPYGPLLGAELVYAYDSQELTGRTQNGGAVALPAETSSMQYRTFGGNLMAGVGLALGKHVRLEGLGVLGVGGMDMDFADVVGDIQQDGSGWYWNTGVRGGIYFTWRRLVVGALVEASRMSYKADANWTDRSTSTKDSVLGVGGRIEIGYRIK